MKLTWKDAAATLIMAAAVAVYLAFLAGTRLPVISGVRGTAAVLLVLGVAGCSLGQRAVGFWGIRRRTKVYTAMMTALGLVTLAAALGALIAAAAPLLEIEFFALFALWLLATLRHTLAVEEPPPPPTRDTHETIDEGARAHH